MVDVVYKIVEHDGGWAYKAGDVFSETFPTRDEAQATADAVAAEQRVPGDDVTISWEDESGRWHEEVERGINRPQTRVETDALPADDVGQLMPVASGAASKPLNDEGLLPALALAGAAAAGYLVGSMLRRRK